MEKRTLNIVSRFRSEQIRHSSSGMVELVELVELVIMSFEMLELFVEFWFVADVLLD